MYEDGMKQFICTEIWYRAELVELGDATIALNPFWRKPSTRALGGGGSGLLMLSRLIWLALKSDFDGDGSAIVADDAEERSERDRSARRGFRLTERMAVVQDGARGRRVD